MFFKGLKKNWLNKWRLKKIETKISNLVRSDFLVSFCDLSRSFHHAKQVVGNLKKKPIASGQLQTGWYKML